MKRKGRVLLIELGAEVPLFHQVQNFHNLEYIQYYLVNFTFILSLYWGVESTTCQDT